jgi:type VI secretion system protein ImpA
VLTAEPVNRDDAVSRVIAAARYLRKTEPGNPAAYLMLRGLRWGEVKSNGGRVEPRLLTAPTTALRSQLKTLLLDSKWTALLEACETAMSQPCGRGWLDLQRYAIVACSHLGKDYYAVEVALRAALRSYLAEVPQIAEVTMMDDTPTGNSETRQWIAAEIDGNAAPAGPHPEGAAAGKDEAETAEGLELARAGRTEDAIDMLTRQLDQERSLRGRFRRRTQLAAILVASEKYLIALPILQELATQIDAFKLEEWESGKMVAEPLALLYMVLHNIQGDVNAKKTLYLRICRLDPIQALKCPQ